MSLVWTSANDLVGGSANGMSDRLPVGLTNGLPAWLTNGLVDWLTNVLAGWLANGLAGEVPLEKARLWSLLSLRATLLAMHSSSHLVRMCRCMRMGAYVHRWATSVGPCAWVRELSCVYAFVHR